MALKSLRLLKFQVGQIGSWLIGIKILLSGKTITLVKLVIFFILTQHSALIELLSNGEKPSLC